MSYSLIWLPSVLKAAGLKVAEVPGWETRGRREMGQVLGVICHHTAGALTGNMPSLNLLINGRSDLAGPLAQLGLGRDGTYYVVAAGLCNHAGTGVWMGLTNGNANFIGIEAENTGLGNDFPWPEIQLDAYYRGVAAILKHIGRGTEFCAGHKEYALPKGRKSDTTFDMITFRREVSSLIEAGVPARTLIPATSNTGHMTIRRGGINQLPDLIKEVQRKVRVTIDGDFGAETEAAIRILQRKNGLVPDGIVGPKTWDVLNLIT